MVRNCGEIEVIMDNPALGLDSVIFESFSCISLDSIMDSIDSHPSYKTGLEAFRRAK